MGTNKRSISKAIKKKVLNRYGGRCAYCGYEFECLEVEHFYPLTYGDYFYKKYKYDVNEYYNLLPACRDCNSCKGTLLPEQFRKYLHEMRQKLSNHSTITRTAFRFSLVRPTTEVVEFYYELRRDQFGLNDNDAVEDSY